KWGLSTTSQLLAASRWEGKRTRRVARTRPPLNLFISAPRLPGVQKIFEMTQLQKRKRHLAGHVINVGKVRSEHERSPVRRISIRRQSLKHLRPSKRPIESNHRDDVCSQTLIVQRQQNAPGDEARAVGIPFDAWCQSGFRNPLRKTDEGFERTAAWLGE